MKNRLEFIILLHIYDFKYELDNQNISFSDENLSSIVDLINSKLKELGLKTNEIYKEYKIFDTYSKWYSFEYDRETNTISMQIVSSILALTKENIINFLNNLQKFDFASFIRSSRMILSNLGFTSFIRGDNILGNSQDLFGDLRLRSGTRQIYNIGQINWDIDAKNYLLNLVQFINYRLF